MSVMVSTVRNECAAADRKQHLILDDNGRVVIVRQKEHVQRERGGVFRGRQVIHTAGVSREPLPVTVCSATCCLPVFQFVIVSFIHHVSAFIHFIHACLLPGPTWMQGFGFFVSLTFYIYLIFLLVSKKIKSLTRSENHNQSVSSFKSCLCNNCSYLHLFSNSDSLKSPILFPLSHLCFS